MLKSRKQRVVDYNTFQSIMEVKSSNKDLSANRIDTAIRAAVLSVRKAFKSQLKDMNSAVLTFNGSYGKFQSSASTYISSDKLITI